jgi:rubrerythrin
MGGAIAIAAALAARRGELRCPHCGHVHRVDRRPVAYRVCPRCRERFPEPGAASRRTTASATRRR